MRTFRRIIFQAVLLYAVFCLTLALTQRSFLYHPDTDFPSVPEQEGADFIRVATEDGLTLLGWYMPPQEGKKTILYFHGNAGNLGHRWRAVRPHVAQGYGVLLAGYRGFGGNEGRPSEQGFYKDARAYISYLTERHGTALSDIVLYGESIGSGPAVQMATEYPDAAALILITPFSSIADLARNRFPIVPTDLMLFDRFDNIAKVGSLAMPQYYFAAAADEIIPPAYTLALYDAASEPKAWRLFDGVGHNDIHKSDLTEAVQEVLATLGERE